MVQTIKAAEFNVKYPGMWDTNKGYVTFDGNIAAWGVKKQQSIDAYKAEIEIEKQKNKSRKERIKELAAIREVVRKEVKNAKVSEDLNVALQNKPVITVTPDEIFENRVNIHFTVGNEKRTRNCSITLLNSMLNSKQRKDLLTLNKSKKFEINLFDYTSILVAGGKRPGIRD